MPARLFIRIPLVLFLLLTEITRLSGQGLMSNGGSIRITDSASLFVSGDVSFQGGSRLMNEGCLMVTGNWSNQTGGRLFRKSTGEVCFKGPLHAIGGDSITVFFNLSFPDSGSTRLMQHITCGGQLNLADHRLFLNGFTLTLTRPSRDALQFQAGHIIAEQPPGSAVSCKTGPEQGLRTIPFGTESGERIPLWFELPDTAGASLLFSTYATNSSLEPLPAGRNIRITPLNASRAKSFSDVVRRYWVVESEDSTVMVHLRFSYSPDEGDTVNPEQYRVISPDAGSGNWQPLPYYQRQEILPACLTPAGNKVFSLASLEPETEQTELTFTAFPLVQNQVITRWFVTNPKADHYRIERSADAVSFSPVDQPVAYKQKQGSLIYELRDPAPLNGYSWYRLLPMYGDSSMGYTEAVKVFIEPVEDIRVNFYPNPVRDMAIMQVRAGQILPEELTFELTDATGKTVYKNRLSAMNPQDDHLYEFRRGSLVPGFYAYRMYTSDELIKAGKIILE